MKIASWNIWGRNHPLKQNGVRHLIRSNHIDVLAILETKCNLGKVIKFIRNILVGWDFFENFDLASGGRILVVWNPASVEVALIQKHAQVLHCYVKVQDFIV